MHGRRPQHADSVVIMAAKGAALRSSASAESLLDPLSRAAAAPSSIASARSSGGDDKSVLSNELSAQASPAPSVNELQLTASLSDLTCAAPPPRLPPPSSPTSLAMRPVPRSSSATGCVSGTAHDVCVHRSFVGPSFGS